MKTLPEEAVEMLDGRRPVIGGAARFLMGSGTYRFWSGYGDMQIDGQLFLGIGARALITPVSSRKGGSANGITISLSALDPDVAQSIENEEYHQKPVTIWRLIFAPDRTTLLGASVFMRGRLDIAPIRETVGGEATIDFVIEGPRKDMGRAGSRMRSDSDQRVLGGATDGGLKHIGTASRKTLRWGQKETKGASSVGGGGGGLGGGGGGGSKITEFFGSI